MIAPFEMFRKGDILEATSTIGVEDGFSHLVETLASAGAHIENAAHIAMIEQPENDVDHIANVDKVAALLAMAVPIATFKKSYHSIAL